MKNDRASRTAVFAAANRALESEKPAPERICYDPLAKKFIGTMTYLRFLGIRILRQGRGYTLQPYILYRCRHFDEYLQRCLAAGTIQLVILGAGLDSRAYRGSCASDQIKTFEVDHPATQKEKIRRVKKAFGSLPGHIVYVPIDFSIETLDSLLSFGFNPSQKTLFLWEGVTYYLTAKAVDAVLSWIPLHSPENSAVIFDYRCLSDARRNPMRSKKKFFSIRPNANDERRIFGVGREQIQSQLAQKGYHHIQDVPAEELRRLYGTGSDQGRWGLKQYAIVSAQVGKIPPGEPQNVQPF